MQAVIFFSEHVGEVLIFLCSVISVLLVIALRRMKRIAELIQEISTDTNRVQACKEKKKSGKGVLTAEEMEALLGEKNCVGKQSEDVLICQEELLTEVLEEVFP